jgi:hypothetical protein
MNNQEFLQVISNSFRDFLESGTSRSTTKLKPLHGAVANDIAERLGEDYKVFSQGYGTNKEKKILGRYIDKRVDITIETKEGKSVCGIAVKFVMQNYSQNSNNYFENMLGETANIRCEGIPYFQIFIILDKLPYYKKNKTIKHWEEFTAHNIEKYVKLSKDDINVYFHTPNKTLIYVVHIPDNTEIKTAEEYFSYYKKENPNVTLTKNSYDQFDNSVIFNDYEKFIDKIYYTIKAL